MSANTVNPKTIAKQNSAGWLLPLLIAGGAFIALAKVRAGPLALPLLSFAFLGAGFILAAVLLLAGSRIGQGRNKAWLAAGALVFTGFAAALLSDGHEAIAQLERMQLHGIASTDK